jgi:hypothetical protein
MLPEFFYGDTFNASLPDGYITLWAGNEIPVGFIPVSPQPKESMGGYLYICKVSNFDYIEYHRNLKCLRKAYGNE